MSKGVFIRGFQLFLIAIVFPQATFQNTAHSTDSTNSSVSSNATATALNATFTDGSAVFPTDATIDPIISPSVTDSTQSITDQTPLSTDLSPYPFTFNDNAPIITNQSRATTASTNDLRAEMNSSYPTNSTNSSATTFTDDRAVLPTDATIAPITSPLGCLCDVTPDFCDIGCCCDVMDCGFLNLSSVFNNCGQDAGSGVCLESWLMLRTQIDPALVTLTGNLLCVQREGEKQSAAQTSSARFQPKSIYPCLLRELTAFNSQKNKFYKVPCTQVENSPEYVIPISTVIDWPEPLEQNGSCLNVVSKVEYVIEYTSKGEIAKATLNTELLNTTIDTQLQQKHVIIFQLATLTHPMATPIPPSPPEGLKPEALLVGWFGEKSQPLTVLGLSEDGGCSADLSNRTPVLFRQNTVTGCTFRPLSSDCGVLRAELLGILAGVTVPDMISMTAGSQTDQSRVISLDCSTPASEARETGCLLPVSLSLQVLWAQRGLRVLPQNHILGAKFIFGCQRLKCPLRSSVPLTTEVMFSDATVYPEAPGWERQPEWKFPFDFFSRGVGEFDQE
ncbi:tectonic-3-like isoform X2 [Siphateles boraxobius]|uniref:tectonic-3-like isoform X2 n=1 Tax=Siphateles boraxobius TaxID=180520 RepID=UPI0040636CA1